MTDKQFKQRYIDVLADELKVFESLHKIYLDAFKGGLNDLFRNKQESTLFLGCKSLELITTAYVNGLINDAEAQELYAYRRELYENIKERSDSGYAE